jgi:hypothetical protein
MTLGDELTANQRRDVANLVHHPGYALLMMQFDIYLANLQDDLLRADDPLTALRKVRQWQVVSNIVERLRTYPAQLVEELEATGLAYNYPEFGTYRPDELSANDIQRATFRNSPPPNEELDNG